ncbi:MAG: SH3 domain-containing protein [Pseudomonadota bacterium]
MIVTFALLAWGFFELSGGTDFSPPEPEVKPLNALLQEVAAEEAAQVARAAAAPATTQIIGQSRSRAQADGEVTLASLNASAPLATVLGDAPASVTPEVEVAVEKPVDLRAVSGSRVNMRNGPGTNYQVLAQLVRGDEAEVLQVPGNGWVKIRASESGRIGWMAERLLQPVN